MQDKNNRHIFTFKISLGHYGVKKIGQCSHENKRLKCLSKSLFIRGSVQTTWTEFWAILTPPPPYVYTFSK